MTLITRWFIMEQQSEQLKKDISGEIIYLNEGWGFINSHEIKYSKIYFHWTGLKTETKNFTELVKGDKVKFEAIKREKGWKAIKIEVIK